MPSKEHHENADSGSLTLTEFLAEAQEQGWRGGNYGKAWRALLAGDIPAQRVGKRWHIRRADLPVIAETLGWRKIESQKQAEQAA